MMPALTYNTAIVLIGTAILGANAGLVGCFAVLRRRALTGDALAHAALPGLCLAFLAVGQRSLPALLFGALVTGVVGVATISLLRRSTRIKEDAAIGIVLSVFFGAGIVLSRLIQNRTVEGSKAGLDSYILGKTAGMIAADVIGLALAASVILMMILLFFKEFQLLSFDAEFGKVEGFPVGWLDLLLMGLVALTVVIGLPAVGVVLMAALLILPAASARFWTDRLPTMLGLAAGFGTVIGLIGTLISAMFSRLPAGPVLVLVGTTLFLISLLFAPRRGIIARALERRRFRRAWQRRLLLLALGETPESKAAAIPADLGWSRHQVERGLRDLERQGVIRRTGAGSIAWTEAGRTEWGRLERGRSLWALFLEEQPDLAAGLVDLGVESPEGLVPEEIWRAWNARLDAQGVAR